MKLNIDFPKKLDSWLASTLAPGVPDTAVAFSFNLFEIKSADAKYGIELIGADVFDPDDSDWARAEAWVAIPRSVLIPHEFSNGGLGRMSTRR
jgi:hypothetical protein